ncbi:DinB family protein [Mucilaginibacter terrae]|uniref:DinB-like domain-containing protein n=1 Tax=Mucilaginibacter terrae TaxID=1955052 RepID=A0ABU3GZ88_9SPHI|nr:DinB family protein [Mucilaginibacter terrae]MDT3405084.1 hypothetical protein [Mucilaginibacter terrae]
MKKYYLLVIALLSLNAYQSHAQQQSPITTTQHMLTPQEKDYASKLLQQTQTDAVKALADLNEAQLKFKPTADKWSIEECMKHIAAAEKNLWTMIEASLAKPANPEARAGIKFTDEELVKVVEDRSHKAKTFEALQPANSPYKTAAEALASFTKNREKLIAFIKNTPVDLRNHVSVLPIGTYDAYQFILLIAAHSNRHTQQIEEVIANANFPKK